MRRAAILLLLCALQPRPRAPLRPPIAGRCASTAIDTEAQACFQTLTRSADAYHARRGLLGT